MNASSSRTPIDRFGAIQCLHVEKHMGPTACVRFLDLRNRRPTGFARGVLPFKKTATDRSSSTVILETRHPCTLLYLNCEQVL